jgi:ribose transport system substrate-binding protein
MKTWMLAALAVTAAFLASAPADADGLDYFQAQLKPFSDKPGFIAPGAAFDARACMAGKSIFSIPVSSANPFTANIEKAMSAAAARVGFKFTVWENQGQSSQWV